MTHEAVLERKAEIIARLYRKRPSLPLWDLDPAWYPLIRRAVKRIEGEQEREP